MSDQAGYTIPTGIIGLAGPVEKPGAGSLPLRGDLAHVALVGRFIAVNYVVPLARQIGSEDVTLKLAMRDDAAEGATLSAGTPVELLDSAGGWAWIACGPDGPSGYVSTSALAPVDGA